MKIKEIDVGKIVLAPMAGVNCTSFRIMCKKYGATLLFTQMYEVKTIIEKEAENKLTEFLNIHSSENPIAIQLIGSINDQWEKAVKILEKHCDIIDINMGCAEKEYLEKRSGSYLLQYPEQVEKIIKKCVSSTIKPITVKIRAGYDIINAIEISKIIENAGACAITLHPRTTLQKYGGKADWSLIKSIKQQLTIPVIGNGDITLPGHAKAMFEQTRCDAIMIGRAAMRDPEIFKKIKYIIDYGKNMPEKEKDGIKLIDKFIKLYLKYEKRKSLNEIKDHCTWFLSSTKNAPSNREKIKKVRNITEITEILQ
jgi:tRNA-dihydrouridine synthase B